MAPAECLNSGVVTAAWPPTRPLLVKRGTRRAIKVPIEEWVGRGVGGGGGGGRVFTTSAFYGYRCLIPTNKSHP